MSHLAEPFFKMFEFLLHLISDLASPVHVGPPLSPDHLASHLYQSHFVLPPPTEVCERRFQI